MIPLVLKYYMSDCNHKCMFDDISLIVHVINKASTARGTLTLLMSAQKSTEREIFTTFCPISIRIRREVMHHLSLEFDVDGMMILL